MVAPLPHDRIYRQTSQWNSACRCAQGRFMEQERYLKVRQLRVNVGQQAQLSFLSQRHREEASGCGFYCFWETSWIMKNAPERKHSVPSLLCLQIPFYTGTSNLLKKPGLHRNPLFLPHSPRQAVSPSLLALQFFA